MPGKYLLLTCLSLFLFFCASAGATIVEGIVVVEQGPLDGAVVKAYLSLQAALLDDNPLISTVGKKSGFFSLDLPAGTYYLTASGSGKEKKFFSFHGANPIIVEDKSIWLPFAATLLTAPVQQNAVTARIIGKVIYKGKPVSDAQVSLYPFSENNIRGLGLQTKSTDADGSFILTTPPASYILVARKRISGKGKMPLEKGDLFCFYGANPLTVEAGRETAVQIGCNPKDDQQAFLEPDVILDSSLVARARSRERKTNTSERGIAGRVLTLDGKPAKGIQVTAYLRDPGKTFQMHQLRLASENMVVTDIAGRYFLPVSNSGSYYLVARQYSGESPLKGELYGLYEGTADQAVTVTQSVAIAEITVGRVMGELPHNDPTRDNSITTPPTVKAPAVIERDTVWSGEVVVEGAVLVARAATLVIAPGTVIRFKRIDRDGDGVGDGEIRVTGRIIARGTSAKPIRFVSAEQVPRPGDWSYLLLFTSGAENIIEHAVFEDAFTGIQAHFSRAVIKDSVFRSNIEGIRFGRAELDIEHNEITGNEVGIRYHRLEGPVKIQRNVIKANGVGLFLVPSAQKFVDSSADTYFPDLRYYMPPLIEDNIITDNLMYNYQLGERLATDIPIGGNWWGRGDPAQIRATVFDRERDPQLGKVSMLPMLSAPVYGAGPRKGGKL